MIYFQLFFIGFILSFLGSVPPGTLNISVFQLGLEKRTAVALRFALAVSIIEYPYAWIGIQFEYWLTSFPLIKSSFQLVTAALMIVLGIMNIVSSQRPAGFVQRFNKSGFRRGLILSILNPMAIPWWAVVTAYLKAQGWIDLSSTAKLHTYVLGTALGAMLLLTLLTLLADRLAGYAKDNRMVKLIPGIFLVALGMYALIRFLF